MYFLVCPYDVMSGKWVSTWSVRYSNSKCLIDVHFTFPELSCMSKAFSESHLQIQ